MEEFEKLLAESFQSDLLPGESTPAEAPSSSPSTVEDDSSEAESTAEIAEESETPASAKPE